mmetsp:Transcript_18332/g.60219  ORF Transcript_18332/g.60219 Transcript_18332/m.60219 type:complete len:201 (+) Transcript_18332:309-911(+)
MAVAFLSSLSTPGHSRPEAQPEAGEAGPDAGAEGEGGERSQEGGGSRGEPGTLPVRQRNEAAVSWCHPLRAACRLASRSKEKHGVVRSGSSTEQGRLSEFPSQLRQGIRGQTEMRTGRADGHEGASRGAGGSRGSFASGGGESFHNRDEVRRRGGGEEPSAAAPWTEEAKSRSSSETGDSVVKRKRKAAFICADHISTER